MMADRTTIRVHYDNYPEESEATPIGPPDSRGQVFRVHRPSFAIANVARDDVVRLYPREDGTWEFRLEVLEQSSWRTMAAPLPPGVRGTAAFDTFAAFVIAQGCVVEGVHERGTPPKLVLSLPPHVPDPVISGPYDEMLLATVGYDHAGLQRRLANERASAQAARRRDERAQRMKRSARGAARGARELLVALAVLAVAAWGIRAFVVAGTIGRPQVAAVAMAALMVPLWALALGDRRSDFGKLWLPGTATALAALALTFGPPATWSYGAAVAVGVTHAIVTGMPGVVLGIFSLFATNTRQWMQAILGIVLPAVLSGVAGLVLALVSLGAAGSIAGVAATARLVAIGVTVFLLAAPVAATINNVAAVLGHREKGMSPELVRGVLRSIPRAMLPAFARIAVPIAIVWLLALVVQVFAG